MMFVDVIAFETPMCLNLLMKNRIRKKALRTWHMAAAGSGWGLRGGYEGSYEER